MRCVACWRFPLTRRNFRFPGNRSSFRGSNGLANRARLLRDRIRSEAPFLSRSSRVPPPRRSVFLRAFLLAVLISSKRSKTVRPAITPFPGNDDDDDPRDRTSKSSHDSDGLSIPLSPEIRSPLGTISGDDVFHFALPEKSAAFMLRPAPVLHQVSMKLRASLTGNIFINFRPEMLSRQLFIDTKCLKIFVPFYLIFLIRM